MAGPMAWRGPIIGVASPKPKLTCATAGCPIRESGKTENTKSLKGAIFPECYNRFCPLGGRGLNGGAETADRPGQDGRDFARGRKSCRYVGVALRFPGPGFGGGRGAVEPDEVKLPAVEQFPLNFITRPQPDGDCQGQREAHIQAGILSARTDRLNSQRISGLHFFDEAVVFLLPFVS